MLKSLYCTAAIIFHALLGPEKLAVVLHDVLSSTNHEKAK